TRQEDRYLAAAASQIQGAADFGGRCDRSNRRKGRIFDPYASRALCGIEAATVSEVVVFYVGGPDIFTGVAAGRGALLRPRLDQQLSRIAWDDDAVLDQITVPVDELRRGQEILAGPKVAVDLDVMALPERQLQVVQGTFPVLLAVDVDQVIGTPGERGHFLGVRNQELSL